MLGAIAGDVIGSVYEAAPIKTRAFPLFQPHSTYTDDSVCTLAIAHCLLEQSEDFARHLRAFGRRHPDAGYGGMFARWLVDEGMPAYGSWGNGAAMRVAAIGWLASDEPDALRLAAASARQPRSRGGGTRRSGGGAGAVAGAPEHARRCDPGRRLEPVRL